MQVFVFAGFQNLLPSLIALLTVPISLRPFNPHLEQYGTMLHKPSSLDFCWIFYLLFLCVFFQKIPLFEDTNLPFIRLLCTKVKPVQVQANEYIVRRGDIGQEMFIIRKGLVRSFIWLPIIRLGQSRDLYQASSAQLRRNLKTHKMFSLHSTREKFENATIIGWKKAWVCAPSYEIFFAHS